MSTGSITTRGDFRLISVITESLDSRLWFEAAHRGGLIYSPYGQFTAVAQCEWILRILEHLSQGWFKSPGLGKLPHFGVEDNWDTAKAIAVNLFNAQFEIDRQVSQEEYDADPDGFSSWNQSVNVESGHVADAWGGNYRDLCRWFIENMSKPVVFAVYQTVIDAVENNMAENIGLWAIGADCEDPRKLAAKAFDRVMWKLNAHIEADLKATTTDTIADLLGT